MDRLDRLREWMSKGSDQPFTSDGVRSGLIGGMATLGVLLFGGGLWAATANLSGAVIAQATVVVDSNVKKVQHATGGRIGEILVKDGDRVEKDQLLLRLDETMVNANLQIIVKQLDEIAVRKTRLIAEQEELEHLAVSPALQARRDDTEIDALLTAEANLFASRRQARLGKKAQLRQRITQLRQEVDGLAAQQWAKGREIELVSKELEGAQQLSDQKLMPISKFTALQREAVRLEGERAQLKAQQAQTAGKIAETELQIIQVDQDMRAEVMKDMTEATAKEGELVERRVTAEDQLRHIDIRAPQAGIVHQLAVHTVGGVIGQGETLMLIVPDHDALVLEAKIMPQNIDHVRTGQGALIRFTAFDQRTTPEFEGHVSRVSADLTHEKETGTTYYSARLALSPEGKQELRKFNLLPGMPAEVHIRTGDRTALSYFLKPLSDQFARAFAER